MIELFHGIIRMVIVLISIIGGTKMDDKKFTEIKHGYQPSKSDLLTEGLQPIKSELPEIPLPSTRCENKSGKGHDEKKK